jgi:hypothetical protein
MSSVLRYTAQIEPSVKYLLALETATVYSLNSGASVTATMSESAFTAATSTSTKAAGTQFRDLGKFVITYNSQKQHTALYRLVQPQLGYTTEGVPAVYATEKFYVRTWTADGSILPISVARTG